MATDYVTALWDNNTASLCLVDAALPIAWQTAQEHGLSEVDAAAVCDSVALALADAVASSRQPPYTSATEPFDALVHRVADAECDRVTRLGAHRPNRPVVIDLASAERRVAGPLR